jgi:hypothetical protein
MCRRMRLLWPGHNWQRIVASGSFGPFAGRGPDTTITDPNARYQKQLFLIMFAFAYALANAKESWFVFCPAAATTSSWHFTAQDLDTEGCDGDRAVHTGFLAGDEAGEAMARGPAAGASTLRPCR